MKGELWEILNKPNTEEAIIKNQLHEAYWIGEDGGMVISRRYTRREAWICMRRLLRNEVDEDSAESLKIDDLQVGYLRMPTTKEETDGEYSWFVAKEWTPYPVWVHWG